MNPYRILKTDNGYEIVRVSYDEEGKPKSFGPLDFVHGESYFRIMDEISYLGRLTPAHVLTYADFKREG